MDDMAEYIASAYRGTKHASKHISPVVMLYGQDNKMAQVYEVQPNSVDLQSEHVYVEGTITTQVYVKEYISLGL